MSILSMSPELNAFCEAHDLYEYGYMHIVTMPNGFRFITRDSNIAESFRLGADNPASVETITELGE